MKANIRKSTLNKKDKKMKINLKVNISFYMRLKKKNNHNNFFSIE